MLNLKGSISFSDEVLDVQYVQATNEAFIYLTKYPTLMGQPSSLHCCQLSASSLEVSSSFDLSLKNSHIESYSASPDGKFLMTGDDRWFVTLWPLKNKGEIERTTEWEIDFNGLIPSCIVKLLPDGTHFIKSDTRLEYWSVKPLKYISSFYSSTISRIRFTNNLKWMIALNVDYCLFVWKIPNLKPHFQIKLKEYNLDLIQIVLLHYCEENQTVIFKDKDQIYSCTNNEVPIKVIHDWPIAEKYVVAFEWNTCTMAWLQGNELHRHNLFDEQDNRSLSIMIEPSEFLDLLWLDDKAQMLAILTKQAFYILDWNTQKLKRFSCREDDTYLKATISSDFKWISIISGKSVNIYRFEQDAMKLN